MADEKTTSKTGDDGEGKAPKLPSPAEKHKNAQADLDRLHEEHENPNRPVG